MLQTLEMEDVHQTSEGLREAGGGSKRRQQKASHHLRGCLIPFCREKQFYCAHMWPPIESRRKAEHRRSTRVENLEAIVLLPHADSLSGRQRRAFLVSASLSQQLMCTQCLRPQRLSGNQHPTSFSSSMSRDGQSLKRPGKRISLTRQTSRMKDQ